MEQVVDLPTATAIPLSFIGCIKAAEAEPYQRASPDNVRFALRLSKHGLNDMILRHLGGRIRWRALSLAMTAVSAQAGVTVYLPKPMTSGINAKGLFGKQDFVYVAADDI